MRVCMHAISLHSFHAAFDDWASHIKHTQRITDQGPQSLSAANAAS